MNLLLLGLSYRTAPVRVREQYAVPLAQLQGIDEKLARDAVCDEVALISTCNRTELVVAAREAPRAADRMYSLFSDEIGNGRTSSRHLYELRDREAVEHVLRVASSLDSMVLGEAQILGQLKDAYRAAAAARSCGPILHRLFARAFRTAKRVRYETGLGSSAVSVARLGVQLAAEVFESFEGKRVLLVGAGEMAESALHGLRDAGASDLVVANRTPETAQRLAERFSARPTGLAELGREIASADIAITSLLVDRPLLAARDLLPALRGRHGRPLLLIDLGVPRNLDPDTNEIDDVYLYDLDDLEEMAERGRSQRRGAVEPAERIVRTEVQRFCSWLSGLDAVPLIRELKARAEALAGEEVQLAARRLPDSPETREVLERMARAITAKLLHGPLECLRSEAEEGVAPYYADAVREIFGLTEEDE